jgi:L-fuconolactonase
VSVKLDGLGMEMLDSDLIPPHPARSSEEIAEIYRPFIITRIEALGANRCMFESAFPVDRSASSYHSVERVHAHRARIAGTVQRVYRRGETKSVRAVRQYSDKKHVSEVRGGLL